MTILLLSFPAFADCTSPSGIESQTQYDFTAHVLKYCNGTNWVDVGGGSNASMLPPATFPDIISCGIGGYYYYKDYYNPDDLINTIRYANVTALEYVYYSIATGAKGAATPGAAGCASNISGVNKYGFGGGSQ